MRFNNIPVDDPASDATNLDIEALRKAEHDQYRESLDQLAPQLSRLSDTHEYLEDLASYIVSKTDFRNSENIRSAQNLISKTYTSNEGGLPEFKRALQVSSDNFLQAMIVRDEHESLDDQLDRSIALCGNLILTLSTLRAKRSQIKSHLTELTPLVERLQVIEDRLSLVSDLQQGTNTPSVTITPDGDKAVQVNKGGQIYAEFNIEYRDIETFFYGSWSPKHNNELSPLSDKFQQQYNRVSYKEDGIDELGESLRKNGWQQPVLLLDGKVFDGIARLLAARKIGETKIPVVNLSDHLMMWRLQAHETSLMVEELISKQTVQYLMASESELRSPTNVGEDLSSAPDTKHRVEVKQTKEELEELRDNLIEKHAKLEEENKEADKKQERLQKMIKQEVNRKKEMDKVISERKEATINLLAITDEGLEEKSKAQREAYRNLEVPIPQSTSGFVKAEIAIVINEKPVTLYYKSEILEMMRNTKIELLGESLDRWKQNPAEFSTNYPLSTIVLKVLSDGVSRTAKELAQALFNRPRGFKWFDVVEQLRPRLTKILWRHWRSGDLKKISRGRYLKTDSMVEYANQISNYEGDINATDSNGNSPLHLAVQQNNAEAAAILIREGADVNLRDNKGRTALHRAAGYNSIEIARLLINHNADIFAKDENGLTAKEWALREKSVGISALLAEIN